MTFQDFIFLLGGGSQEISKKVFFKNTVFQGDVIFDSKNRRENIVFNSKVDFSQMKIEGDAIFDRVVFFDHVEAFDMSFKGGASFRNTRFDGGVDFAYSHFGGITIFNSSIFTTYAIFWFTSFIDRVEFDNADFKSAHFPILSDAIFEGEVSMNNIRSLTPPDFTDAVFKKSVIGL